MLRPLNRCDACNYTWYPQGENRSRRCPGCGSEAVQCSWLPLAAPIIGGGLFLMLLACGGVFALINQADSEPPAPVAKAPPVVERPLVDRDPPTRISPQLPMNPGAAIPPGPAPIPPGRPEPIKKVNTPSLPPTPPIPKPEPPVPVVVKLSPADFLAPHPHPPRPNRPPLGFASGWDQCGPIQARVVGAKIMHPTLVNKANQHTLAPEPMLVVWVETQSLSKGRTVRRWQNPLGSYAQLKDTESAKIEAATLPADTWVGGQIQGAQPLTPGAAGVVDVLAFEIPSTSSRDLWLKLDGANVSERNMFLIKIPYDVWSKR
ncbi:unnamed protein product [Gemmata massiliana]|uniref:Uncharacterized protein n=1 Tax=Gemmata massiliana TaxID=1210884 RepID=A0A6P2CRX4_9BACT|nr:hypothetical protein [Gemmata massiliana]VTR91848.1 unnamed protein product [Gemmata massiliana]